MAFEIKNSGGASWGDFKTRTNPTATATNVYKAKVESLCCGARIDIDLTYQVNNAGADVDFTQNTVIADLRYYTIYLCDGDGNEAVGAIDIAATTTLINVDTSALNAGQTWNVQVKLSNSVPTVDCDCDSCYMFDIAGASGNPTDTITTADLVGALSVDVDGTTVATAGTAVLAAASIGDVVVAALDLSNVTANSLLNISSVTVSGDGSFNAPGGLGFLPVTLDDATSNNQWSVLMDTATAGAPKSATVTIVSDDAASPYVITIEVTVS